MLTDSLKKWRGQFLEQVADPFFMETMFDSMPDLFFYIKDVKGHYVLISDAIVERCGLKHKHEAIGKTAFDLFPEVMAKRYTEQDERIIATGRPLIDSLDLTVFNNRRRGWCLTTKHPLRNRKNAIVGLACLSKDLIEPSTLGFVDEQLSAATDYVRENYSENISLEALAKIAHLSVSQLDRRIKRIFNLTTGQFIIKTRVDAVARLLLETDQPAGTIAIDCGFCDQSAMSKQFRQVTGFTPSAYRKFFAAEQI